MKMGGDGHPIRLIDEGKAICGYSEALLNRCYVAGPVSPSLSVTLLSGGFQGTPQMCAMLTAMSNPGEQRQASWNQHACCPTFPTTGHIEEKETPNHSSGRLSTPFPD